MIDRVFADGFDSVVVANDDIVLTPTSYQVLMDDVALLKKECPKLGWVAARCDASRATQNIRSNPFGEELYYFKHPWEEHIMPMECPSPIFAWISRDAWEVAKFPPLNWYSDDVHCMDLIQKGYAHYVSASYAMSQQKLTTLLLRLSSRMINLLSAHGSAESAKPSMAEDMINCSRCTDPTPESELLEVGAWWVCGICYDDL